LPQYDSIDDSTAFGQEDGGENEFINKLGERRNI